MLLSVKLQGTPKKLLMENKDLGGWLVLNGNSASSYIITAFDNFEDSLHVYYLILPPLSIHSYLLHHKHLDMLQKSTFPASPKQKQGFYIKQFCATRDYLLQTMWDLHLCRKLMEFTCFWGAAGSVLLCNRWGAVNGFNSLAIKCLLYFTSLTINTSWSMPADFLNGRGHTLFLYRHF